MNVPNPGFHDLLYSDSLKLEIILTFINDILLFNSLLCWVVLLGRREGHLIV